MSNKKENDNRIIDRVEVKKGVVKIGYKRQNKEKFDTYNVVAHDAPVATFPKAMNALVPFVVDICELPKDYASRMTVTAVSFTWKGEDNNLGAVITAHKTVKTANSPFNIHTPFLLEGYDESKKFLPKGCTEALLKVLEEAKRYLNGDRLQQTMFNEDGKQTPKTAKTPKAPGTKKPAPVKKAPKKLPKKAKKKK